MITIRKPKYKGYVLNKSELSNVIETAKKKYEKLYPDHVVTIIIEPDTINFDGTIKEFTYRAEIIAD